MTRRGWLAGLSAAVAGTAQAADEWSQFRGPGARGLAAGEGSPPAVWSETENVLWRRELPGTGWSSPVVWDDRIFVTAARSTGDVEPIKKGLYFGGNRLEPPKEEHVWTASAVDFGTGRVLWERELHRGVPATPRHLKNSYASETPATDGERLYAHFGHLGTWALDFNGEVVWKKSWPPHEMRYGWGTAASPVLHGGRLYLVNDNEDKSSLTVLEAATGKEIFRVARDEPSNWATPFVWENEERTELVIPGRNKVRSYDLDGKVLWELGGMSSIVIPTPFTAHGLLYVTSGYVGDETRPVFAIRPGAEGDISLGEKERSNSAVAWSLPQGGPYNPSPLVYGDYYYTLYDRGFLTCHDAKTGEEIYGKKRFRTGASAFTASPWAYDEKIFCLSEDGDCFVVEAGPEYRLLHENSIPELSMATPAVVDDSLILRTAPALYRIESA